MAVDFLPLKAAILDRTVELKYSPTQARQPAGTSTGGEFASTGGTGNSSRGGAFEAHTVTDIFGIEHTITDWPANWGTEPGTYTAYRGGDLESKRGIFLAPDKESAQAYAGLHGSEVVEYKVTIEKPLVFNNYLDGMATVTGKSREKVAESRDRSQNVRDWTRSADKKIATYAKNKGYDAVVYIKPPLPALREINFLGKKTKIVPASQEKKAMDIDYAELKAGIDTRVQELKYSPNQPRVPAGRGGGGQFTSGGGSVSGGGGGEALQVVQAHAASDVRSQAQVVLGGQAEVFRKEGSETYVSTQARSPNMGERHYIDIGNHDPKIQRAQVIASQKQLTKHSKEIQKEYPGAKTYVAAQRSPNSSILGTRVFIDVDMSKYRPKLGK